MDSSAKLIEAGNDLMRHEKRAQLTNGFEQFSLTGSSEVSLLSMLKEIGRAGLAQYVLCCVYSSRFLSILLSK